MDFLTVKFLLGASPNSAGTLDSHMSLLANTLLSRTDSNLPFTTGSLDENFKLSTGDGLEVFLELLASIHAGVVALIMDPHREDALVLVDLRDAPEMEDVSEIGDEWPDEASL